MRAPAIFRMAAVAMMACMAAGALGAETKPMEPQSEIGTRVKAKPEAVDPVAAGETRKKFALCFLQDASKLARRIVANGDLMRIDWGAVGNTPDRLYEQDWIRECLGHASDARLLRVQMMLTDSGLRALLLEELYLRNITSAPAIAADAPEAIARTLVSSGPELEQARALGAFADCVVFHDAAHADAMLRTPAGTKVEREAAQALAPTLGSCLMQGQTISFTTTNIRAIVADGLWTRFAQQAAPAVATRK